MEKVINQYFCDHCGKEVESTDHNNPLNIIDLRIDDGYKRGYILRGELQLCNDCNKKLKKDIDSMVSFLRNHWITVTKEEEET